MLNLDFSKYKGITRLRNWWTVVKANFEAVQSAFNQEVTDREKGDSDNATALSQETTNRQSADANIRSSVISLNTKISEETSNRTESDAKLEREKLNCFDFGGYSSYYKTVSYSAEEYDYNNFKPGSFIQFSIYGGDCNVVELPTGWRNVDYDTGEAHDVKISISYPFKNGHYYIAVMTEYNSQAEVVCDNGEFVDTIGTSRLENGSVTQSKLAADVINLISSGAGGGGGESLVKSIIWSYFYGDEMPMPCFAGGDAYIDLDLRGSFTVNGNGGRGIQSQTRIPFSETAEGSHRLVIEVNMETLDISAYIDRETDYIDKQEGKLWTFTPCMYSLYYNVRYNENDEFEEFPIYETAMGTGYTWLKPDGADDNFQWSVVYNPLSELSDEVKTLSDTVNTMNTTLGTLSAELDTVNGV